MKPSTLSEEQLRRNFILGVANGTLFRLFAALTHPSLVLTWFVSQLGASSVVIGLLLPISTGGWLLPQLPVSGYVQHQRRKMVVYRAASVVRTLCWTLLTISVFILGPRNERLLLAVFVLLFAGYSFAAGVGGLPFMDVVGKAIAADRRGSFFAWRGFAGGLLALGGSALTRYVLDEQHGLAFPANFGLLFAIAGVAAVAGFCCFAQVTEPVEDVSATRKAQGLQLLRIGNLLRRDSNHGLFIAARVALLVSTVAIPFYSVFARERLGAPVGMVGTYLGAFTAAVVGSTLLWGWLSDRFGNRVGMLLVSVLSIPLPLVPILFSDGIPYAVFTLAFLGLGIIQGGIQIVSLSFVLDIAPLSERVLYIGLVNTVLGVVSFMLVIGGFIAERWGLSALFGLSSASALVSLVLTLILHEPRPAKR